MLNFPERITAEEARVVFPICNPSRCVEDDLFNIGAGCFAAYPGPIIPEPDGARPEGEENARATLVTLCNALQSASTFSRAPAETGFI